ncbi:class I glutamine amidotransferase-like protein [Neoconidiobolus thromboides FSU 785]|nr:class I glutamine amidotransferase-like protein [Neoconidiobolus thromboides FSU 785]
MLKIIHIINLLSLSILLSSIKCSEYASNGDWSRSKNIIDPYFPIQSKYKVGAILYEGFAMLDLIGPVDILSGVSDKFEIETIGLETNSTITPMFEATSFNSKLSMKQAIEKEWDILLTPGGYGVDKLIENQEFIENYKKLIAKSKVIFTVCTGSLALAKTGLLNGFKATTNKVSYQKETPLYPEVDWQPRARWVHHRQFITSSGIAAGMDSAFYIVSLAKSREEAEKFSKGMEYVPNWDPDNDLFAVNITKSK